MRILILHVGKEESLHVNHGAFEPRRTAGPLDLRFLTSMIREKSRRASAKFSFAIHKVVAGRA
jgi:hypothetical protein